MNRSNMPKQIMAFSNGGLASFIPRQTKIAGQPHMLAYINPREEQILQDYRGNAPVVAGPAGVPSYLFGFDSISDMFDGGGKGGSGANFSTGSHADYVAANPGDTTARAHNTGGSDDRSSGGRNFDADMSAGSGTVYSSQDDTYTSDAGALPTDVGLVDSLLMGVGLKDKTAAYYSATADTIARTRGADAAAKYIDEMNAAGNISDADATALKTSTSYTAQDAEDRGLLDSQQDGGDDQTGGEEGTDQTGDDQTGGEEGGEEDTGPPSSMNFRFFGGYQPRTRADVLVASPGADQPFVMPDDPRITPIFNPDDNIDEILNPTAIGPTEGYGGQLAADILATDYGPDPFGPIPEATTDVPVFGEEGTIAVPGSEADVPDFEVPAFNPLTAQGGISAVEQRMIDQFGYTANPDGTISRGDTIYDSEQGGFLQGGTAAMTPAEILAQQERIAGQASDLLAQQGGVQKTPEEMLQQIQETQARYRTGAPGAPAEAFDFGAPANVGDTYFDPMTNTTYEYTEKPMGNTGQTYQGWDIKSGTGGQVGLYGAQPVDPGLEKYGPEGSPLQLFSGQPQSFAAGVTPASGTSGQGQFATMQELMEFQQQYPSANLMGEYQRLKALEGGAAQPAVLPQRGVASLMGGDPATEAMYQGIMS